MEKIKISSKTSIYQLATSYPEIIKIMQEIGFNDITKPMMLQTAGRYMTLEKGAQMKKIDWEVLVKIFGQHGYELE